MFKDDSDSRLGTKLEFFNYKKKTLINSNQEAQAAFSKLSYAILCPEQVSEPISIPFHEYQMQ